MIQGDDAGRPGWRLVVLHMPCIGPGLGCADHCRHQVVRDQGPSDPGPALPPLPRAPIRARGKRDCASTRRSRSCRVASLARRSYAESPSRACLILAVRHDGAVSMPPKKKLATGGDRCSRPPGSRWALPGPTYSTETPRRLPARRATSATWDDKARAFWAFQPPTVPSAAGGRRFVLAPLADRPLHPGAAGGRRAAAGASRPTSGRCSGGRRSTSGGSPPPRGNRRLPARRLPTRPLNGSSTACWPPRVTASAGAGTGWTSRATPTATAWTTTSPTPTPGVIAIT